MTKIELNPKIEEATKESISQYLKNLGQINLEQNVNNLMNIDGGFIDRFNYFTPLINDETRKKMLISGCSIGSEMIVAKKFDFEEIYGTEVTTEYVNIAKKRLANDNSMHVDLYDGARLPYTDDFFSMICSGHIIEHTKNPRSYIEEHLRTLKKGGFFFLEFPNRYNLIELHTGEKSFEWLPLFLRNRLLKHLSKKKPLYNYVLKDLMPISIWQIALYSFFSKDRGIITSIQIPATGYVRMLIKKI